MLYSTFFLKLELHFCAENSFNACLVNIRCRAPQLHVYMYIYSLVIACAMSLDENQSRRLNDFTTFGNILL